MINIENLQVGFSNNGKRFVYLIVGCNADAKHSNELVVGRKSDKPITEIKREDIL